VGRKGNNKMQFDSKLEIAEAPLMAGLGIARCTDRLPMTFTDPSGSPFHREPDWLLSRRRWRCYLETKAYLNSQPDRATATDAARQRQPGRSDQWHIAETSWSNSIVNNAIVHHEYGPSNIIMVLPDSIFKPVTRGDRKGKLPAATVTTLNRLKAAGVWWLKTSDLQGYIRARDVSEAWHEQHTPQPAQSAKPGDSIELWCRTSDQLDEELQALKAEGYRLKRGSKTATSCTVYLPE
jgi:hypothetical protein